MSSQFNLEQPIGIFDAGIGSYAMVERVRSRYPSQDLLYLADRASFPYGSKSKDELTACVEATIRYLLRAGCRAVVLASNAPSVLVLPELQERLPLPVLGIYPPVVSALRTSKTGQVAVLGVASLIDSPEIRSYVHGQAGERPIGLVNASCLVAMVEDGTFLSDPNRIREAVSGFMKRCRHDFPGLDVCTLSSTHLPWLLPHFEEAAPDISFLDPIDEVLPFLEPFLSNGSGTTVCLATESPDYPLEGLSRMLERLGVPLRPEPIRLSIAVNDD